MLGLSLCSGYPCIVWFLKPFLFGWFCYFVRDTTLDEQSLSCLRLFGCNHLCLECWSWGTIACFVWYGAISLSDEFLHNLIWFCLLLWLKLFFIIIRFCEAQYLLCSNVITWSATFIGYAKLLPYILTVSTSPIFIFKASILPLVF